MFLSTLKDLIRDQLATAPDNINDAVYAQFSTTLSKDTAINDLTYELFGTATFGSQTGAINDRVFKGLGSLGYTGTIGDRMKQWMAAGASELFTATLELEGGGSLELEGGGSLELEG